MNNYQLSIINYQLLLLLIIAISFFSCGYRFSGTGKLPSDIRCISVTLLENRTAEPGVEHILTNDLINEFLQHGIGIESPEEADGVLSGRISGIHINTITYLSRHNALERQVTASVDLTLKNASGEAVWSATVSESEAYVVGSDRTGTERNLQNAIISLSERLSERVYQQMTYDF